MGFMFGFMQYLFPVFFLIPLVIFGIVFFRIIKQWNTNNHSPRLTVEATVVGRRQHRSSGSHDHTGHTSYYITFQVESGDRLELHIPSTDFGYIVEGDRGKLTFQGSRFLSFERTI